MQITITDDGIKVTDALKQYILDKFKRLERITHKTSTLHITLSLEHLDQVAKALMHTHGNEFYARAKNENLYTAIDELIDKIEQQINKHKLKSKEKRHDRSEKYDPEGSEEL
ncbi:ribosome hibernation-promoting factor, HPF/YfiA family [Rickettsiella grylli]|uniref:Ribosome hibernation promoting factor n=1 Tax=Rickettsiella grylli TaxID=59196 RepID=A8PQ11_9COXI|nr:ribosome-associated translation inhibitor RaiA [Rickettsiella grylli]EDP45670.1 ribosomal subunit interface protein [Rickettsiella grylli]EDP46359.1 ribosomal subunit interface protein [Rickettsiella grylli]OJA00184.1 ribosomal subunit interface protein [Rickettsiella grylli]